jgi:hypothetical protein
MLEPASTIWFTGAVTVRSDGLNLRDAQAKGARYSDRRGGLVAVDTATLTNVGQVALFGLNV